MTTMFAGNRRQHIVDILMRETRVEVSQLSRQLGVSEVTIRKDLEYLEQMDVLIRTHGGAVLKDGGVQNSAQSSADRRDASLEPTQTIARIVPYMVEDGDLIYLGTQSICTEIAQFLLKKQQLTVITNNVSAAIVLGDNPNITIILPGGQMIRRGGLNTLSGADTVTFMASKYVDKAIISADGVKFSTGYSVQDISVAQIYRDILQRADEVIVAVESDLFNKNAFADVGALTLANKIVSDKLMPEEYMRYYFEHEVQVFTSYDLENL